MKKIVQLKFLATIVFAILFIGAAYAQETKTVIVVHDGTRIDPVTDASPELQYANPINETLGYEIVMMPNPRLEEATEEQLDQLRAADLIIIGRAVGSGNWTAAGREIWNTIATPILSTNPFAIRTNQLQWFFGSEQYGPDGELFATVNFPEDDVFEGVELDENDQFLLWEGSWSSIKVDPAFPGDGQFMIQRMVNEGATIEVFFARFEAGEPFYDGGLTPAGPRTYFGMGVDGDNNYRYWNYSDDGKTIFLREVARMANLEGGGTNVIDTEQLNVSVYPNPATNNLFVKMNNLKKAEIWDLTGKLIYSVAGNGHEVIVDISNLNTGIYFVKAIDNNNNTVVRKVVKNQ